jgi:GT2 family glycosyltransferase
MMKITLVIVVYKIPPKKSSTFCSLLNVLRGKNNNELSIIIYDNSPENQAFDTSQYQDIQISYIHDGRNLGIATAYNYALDTAKENGSEWLLLLDHDTHITNEYIEEVLHLQRAEKNIAAVVPRITSENTLISPVYSDQLRPLKGDKPNPGIQNKPVMAINSGALVRVEYLKELGGFNKRFPLDYLDHWLFHEIYTNGSKVLLLEATLDHELSVMDYSRISLTRYQSILDSEINFYKNYKRDLVSAYRKQLTKRFLKQVLTVKNKKIAMYTLRRLFSM